VHVMCDTRASQRCLHMVATSEQQPQAGNKLVEEPCEFAGARASDGGGVEVSCASPQLQPVVKRSRGTSTCVCADSQHIFAVATPDFVAVRFADCSENSARCRVGALELGA